MCPQNNDTTNIVPAVEITDDEDATRDDVNIVSVDWSISSFKKYIQLNTLLNTFFYHSFKHPLF